MSAMRKYTSPFEISVYNVCRFSVGILCKLLSPYIIINKHFRFNLCVGSGPNSTRQLPEYGTAESGNMTGLISIVDYINCPGRQTGN